MPCRREQKNNHYQGQGYGSLKNDEEIVFAVFDTEDQIGAPLKEKSISTKPLKNGDFSIARLSYTSREALQKNVIDPQVASGKKFVGLSTVTAEKLRSLQTDMIGTKPMRSFRAVCVLDKVEQGDHPGHAALQTCLEEGSLSEAWKGKWRTLVAADLSRAFSALKTLDQVYN